MRGAFRGASVAKCGAKAIVIAATAQALLQASAHAQCATWTPMEAGLPAQAAISVLHVHDGQLYAAGGRQTSGGAPWGEGFVARWTGASWQLLPGTFDGQVVIRLGNPPITESPTIWDLASFDGRLLASGGFRQVDGLRVDGLAEWDGQAWRAFGPGFDATVWALGVHEGSLYAGGSFTRVGAVEAPSVARWNGQAWSPVGAVTPSERLPGLVSVFTVFGSRLVAGGASIERGLSENEPTGFVAALVGDRWTPLTHGSILPRVRDLAVHEGVLYVGWTSRNGLDSFPLPVSLSPVLALDPDSSSWTIPMIPADRVYASSYPWATFAQYRGELIMAGQFTRNFMRNPRSQNVFRLDPPFLRPMSESLAWPPRAVIEFEGSLIAAGSELVGNEYHAARPTVAWWRGGPGDLDFNNDGVFPDVQDLRLFLLEYSGTPCPMYTSCDSIDFNGDGVWPDLADLLDYFEAFAGDGAC